MLLDSLFSIKEELFIIFPSAFFWVVSSMEFVEIYCLVSIIFIFVDNWFIIFWAVEGTILLDTVRVVVVSLIEIDVEMVDWISLGTVVVILFEPVVLMLFVAVVGTELGIVL